MRNPAIAVLAAVLCLLSFLAPAGAQDAYRLQPGDVIEITVIEDPNLDRRVLIGPDGRISLPLAGFVEAAGRTLGQLQATVQSQLSANFVRPPTVTASLVALAPPPLPEFAEEEELVLHEIYILGEVNRPGRYEYDSEKPISVIQALAMAGGPGVFADRDRIQVRTLEDGIESVRFFDYDAIEEGLGAILGQTLPDGTVILVPERGLFN